MSEREWSGGDGAPDRGHPSAELSAYADGELEGAAMRRVSRHVDACTECAREVALIRAMGEAMREPVEEPGGRSVWEEVHRRVTRPAGWVLVVAGAVILGALAVVEWFRAGTLSLEWLATTAIAVGGGLLVVSIGYEQYREWKSSPYRDVKR